MTFPAHRPLLGRSFAFAALLVIAAPGCSERPAAPPIPGPTRFVVFSSDRDRAAGSYRNYLAALNGAVSQVAPRTGTGLIDQHPSLTQDGRQFCFQSGPGRGGSQDVLIFDLSNNALLDDPNVNTTFDEIDPQISLDGTRLVFVRDTLGVKSIRLYDLTTSRLIPLPGLEDPGFSDWAPAIDAQGRNIAFTTNRNRTDDVMLYRLNTLALDPPSALQSVGSDVDPAFSGDGRYVAFASNRTGGAGDYDVLVFDTLNGLLVTMPSNANSSAVDRDPTISSDGSNLVFVSNRPNGQGGMDLWTLNRIGGVLSQTSGLASAADDLEPFLVWP